MTLDQMNKYFEDHGFTVDRLRDSKRDVYIFNIAKNGRDLSGEFKYPKTRDWRLRDRDQRAFLENLMREFHAKQSFNEATALYEKCLHDLTTFKEENERFTASILTDEPYDPEKGLAMAFAKRVLGNQGNYYNTFRKWLPEPVAETKIPIGHQTDRWKIWFKRYGVDGKVRGSGVYQRDYASKSSAIRAAKRVYDSLAEYEWVVSQTNPWVVKE